MPYRELDFDSHNVVLALSEVQDLFRRHFERGCRYVTQRVYEKILAVDFDGFIGADRHQRTSRRRGQRKGYRSRCLVTSVGVLDRQVPRDRQGKYRPALWARYQRVDRSLEATIRAMFLSGVSTRRGSDVLDALCGERLSASKVSPVVKEFDQAVRAFGNCPIEDKVVFLFLDALSVRIRFGLKAKRVKLRVAYGIGADGTRQLLGFQRAKLESYACWKTFVDNLPVRGLTGKNLKLIVMDGAVTLWAAVEAVYPFVEHQLCWVHKLRNVANYCPKHYRPECVRQAAQIMYAASGALAAQRFRAWKKQWQDKIPKAVACLERDFDKLIPVFGFPEAIRKMIRTTNVIERCFREVRRRLKVMGYFQNSPSCDRIVSAIFHYWNTKWQRPNEKIKAIKTLCEKAA
jgi:putative transposase